MSRPDDVRFGLAEHGITLGEIAGRGGSGEVYRGLRTSTSGTSTDVAVKVLHDPAEVGRITREAASLARLDHAGIAKFVEVIDLRDTGGPACLVTEWAAGVPLSHLLRKEAPLAPARALVLFAKLAAALDYAHSQGVVHRDVSPDNVMVSDDGGNAAVTLIDFGLSRTADSAALTADGLTAGTPRYLAPEVIVGADPTQASDAYSAAVIFYEMLTGHWPFGDAGATISTAIHHHLHSAPIPPSEANPWLSPAVDAGFGRALDKAPENRFETVHDFFVSVEANVAEGGNTPQPQRQRRNALIGAAVACAVGIIAIAAFLIAATNSSDSTLVSIAPLSSGTAASLSCNLLDGTGFDSGRLPEIYYDGVADQNELVDFGGVGDSPALRIGTTDGYGLYGERIVVTPGVAYVFSAHVSVPADVDRASIRLFWLDENFELVGDEYDVPLTGTGQVSLVTDTAPDAARYAVPSLVKEASPGSLVADELVFAAQTAECADQLGAP